MRKLLVLLVLSLFILAGCGGYPENLDRGPVSSDRFRLVYREWVDSSARLYLFEDTWTGNCLAAMKAGNAGGLTLVAKEMCSR